MMPRASALRMDTGTNVNLNSLRIGATIAGVAIGGGAAIGAGVGAWTALSNEPSADAAGLTRMEKRSVFANAIAGAFVGALGGAALVGVGKMVTIKALKGLPMPAMLALGGATGAAAVGAGTLAHRALN